MFETPFSILSSIDVLANPFFSGIIWYGVKLLVSTNILVYLELW